jgi:hypothetical protein
MEPVSVSYQVEPLGTVLAGRDVLVQMKGPGRGVNCLESVIVPAPEVTVMFGVTFTIARGSALFGSVGRAPGAVDEFVP